MRKRPRRIGIIGFAGAEALDINGPFDVFATANRIAGEPAYEPMLLGLGGASFATESGLRLQADLRLDRAPSLDTLIVPGGAVLRTERGCEGIVRWLEANAGRLRRVVSVCTGAYALAAAALLDGRRATTHWRYAEDLARRWPAIDVDCDAIFIKDGPYYTSAGITAGIDLALSLVEEDLGAAIALAVARELVVYLKRSGGQMQYSEPLRYQTGSSAGFGEIAGWMRDNLRADLTVEGLAERACLSPRHFNRKFKSVFGSTPATFVNELRLDEARWRLASGGASIEAVAGAVGYRSDDAFRRAFHRHFGITPSEYRERFLPKTSRARQ